MKILRKKMILFTGIITVFFACFTACTKKQINENAVVTFVLGDVTIQRGADTRSAEVREVLKDGDIITTGEKSYMVVQMGTRLMFRVEAESKLEIKSITEFGKNELNLTNGTVLSKLSKLKKDENYNIKTPTTVASVRGTVFSTAYNSGITNVAVAEGKVNVIQISSGNEKAPDAGMAADVTDTITVRKIGAVEKLVLRKIEETPIIENINTVNDEQLKDAGNKILENDMLVDNETDKMLNNKRMTLADIKAEYGRIDVVKMYNGQVYSGAILSRGNTIKMITPSGTLYLDGKKVKQTESR